MGIDFGRILKGDFTQVKEEIKKFVDSEFKRLEIAFERRLATMLVEDAERREKENVS